MCTLIVSWKEGLLTVGANRDEIADRPSEPFKYRENLFCPLDVLGGTWIGINKKGVFAALTNLDAYYTVDFNKVKTRGNLVLKALNAESAKEASTILLSRENPLEYKGCVLLIADKEKLFAVIFDGRSVEVKPLEAGLHVSTGWGLNAWHIPRCDYIKKKYDDSSSMKGILKYHGGFNVESEVCVHDPEETHKTRSSCIITTKNDWSSFLVEHIDTRPCEEIEWEQEIVKIQK